MFFLASPVFWTQMFDPFTVEVSRTQTLGDWENPRACDNYNDYINVFKCNNTLETPSPFCLRRLLNYTNETNSSLLMKHETVLS